MHPGFPDTEHSEKRTTEPTYTVILLLTNLQRLLDPTVGSGSLAYIGRCHLSRPAR